MYTPIFAPKTENFCPIWPVAHFSLSISFRFPKNPVLIRPPYTVAEGDNSKPFPVNSAPNCQVK